MKAPRLVPVLIIVAAVAFVYRSAVSAYFFDDDFQWLVGTMAFQPAHLLAVGQMGHFYRPVIDLYFATSVWLHGGSPMAFHLASIALHLANGLILFALARAISGRFMYGFLAALFFVVQPAHVDAVAWVGALAEVIGAFFGCLSLLWFIASKRGGSRLWHVLSAISFGLALLTHESSVMFFPLLVLADWAFLEGPKQLGAPALTWDRLRVYVPYGFLLTVYLAVDLQINSRNYVVTEGHYGIGPHVITNALEYIVALYVGRHDVANYILITGVLAAVLIWGRRRAVFATAWMVLALLPFVFFTWSNTSRYEYLPAMGFSMLLAEGVLGFDRLLLKRRWPGAMRTTVLLVLSAAIAVRFAAFAARNVTDFANKAEDYRRYVTDFRLMHGKLTSHTTGLVGPQSQTPHVHAFLNAAVQWEYRDPTIQLAPEAPPQ